MRRAIPAGLIDSGFAAMATFSVTIYGSRAMSPEDFGFFALFWAAFLMAAIVPGQVWFQPWEVEAAKLIPEARSTFLMRPIRIGLGIALIAGVAASAMSWILAYGADQELKTGYAFSLVAAASVSPIQDFVRRMFHVAGRSERAAVVSLVQFLAAIGGVFALSRMGLDPVWVPFAALVLANIVSAATGLAISGASFDGDLPSPRTSDMLRSGSWLLVLGLAAPLAGFLVNWLVITVAGAALLGLAESARIVGRPVLVVTNGLGQALRPRSFEAAGGRDQDGARRIRRAFTGVTLTGGIVYTVAVSLDWPGNVMMGLVPNGFEIAGLVTGICLANTLVGVNFPERYELIALRRERYTTGVEMLGQVLKTVTAGAAGVLGGFVIPLGDALLGIARFVGYRLGLRDAYLKDSDVSGLSARRPDQP